jgi:hypothetical protein
MKRQTLEERVAALEQEMTELRAAITNGVRPKDWRRTIGMFTDDPEMLRIFEEALKYREADRKKFHARERKARQAKQ